MRFDRPVAVDLYVTLTVEGIDGATVDTAAIADALAERTFRIAAGVDAAELYATVYAVSDNFIATLLEISDDDVTYTDGRLTPDYGERYQIQAVNVDITDITP
jgi:hypothetical protein